MHEYIVKSILNKDFSKIVTLEENGKQTKKELHRYSSISQGDTLIVSTANSQNTFAKSDNGEFIQIQPHFEVYDEIRLGKIVLPIKITELVDIEDFKNYNYLEQYHYKSTSVLPNESNVTGSVSSGGRKCILLLYLKLPATWQAVGYIELQMPLMMCKPRHVLFNNPYNNLEKQISWEKWDSNAIKNYVNRIVRIGRIVTAPEFRGLALSKYLIKSAKEFSINRWHIKGKKPIFMEISAEMLKYIDFVSTAGFFFVGLTEGNKSRVYKDLSYMDRGYNISSGIMSLQKRYLKDFKELANELNLNFLDALNKLTKICKTKNIEDALGRLSLPEYYLYKSVLRLPIPYYLMPLDEYSQTYLTQHLPVKTKDLNHSASKKNLTIKNLCITASYELNNTKYVRAILNGFGLKGDKLTQKIISDFSLTASAGNIAFISGVSGTGKSVLLDLLNNEEDKRLKATSEANNIRLFKVSKLTDIKSSLPLIEHFSRQFGIEKSLAALSRAGLSEAFIYLKPYSLLSKGQQYRARFAKLILEDADIWLLDEFCSDLDVLTAKIVATNLRHLINKYSKIAIIAAANHEHFIDSLKPTQVIVLESQKKTRVISYKDYKHELFSSQ